MLYSEVDKGIKEMLMKSTFELRNILSVNKYVESYKQANFKHFFIAAILDEMLNLETAMIRWDDFFSEEINEESVKHPVGASILQAVSNEIKMYQRKNIEILTKLILFQDINEERYYKHYIFINEYNAAKRKLGDFNNFFAIVPHREQHEFNELGILLVNSIKDICEQKCWFLNLKHKPTKFGTVILKTNEDTFKNILLKAIPRANKYEKLVLGLSYQRYSKVSQGIHNSISLNVPRKEEIENACKMELLMAALIVNKCQDLMNIYPHLANEELKDFISDLPNNRLWIEPLFQDIFEENDYVYTNDDALGRIEEIIVSNVGYRSFRVRYLADGLPEFGEYGYYPAHYLKRIHSRKQLEDILINNPNEILKDLFKYMNAGQMTNGLDNIMSMWWHNGYKEKVLSKTDLNFSETLKTLDSILDKDKIEELARQKILQLKTKSQNK